MNLLTKLNSPILDCLTRIYRKNGHIVETTKKYKQRQKRSKK